MIVKTLLIMKRIKFICKKKFAIIALNLDIKIFIIYITALGIKTKMMDHLSKISIPLKYFNYIDIFFPKFIAKLLGYSNNNYLIMLKKSK